MANKAVDAAALALTQALGTATGGGTSALDDLAKLVGGVGQKIAELEQRHLATGKKIDAWNELPAGSASSIAEARGLIEVIETDIDAVRGLVNKLERAKKVSKRVPDTSQHVDTIHAAVDGWLKDLEADKEALLVAARAVVRGSSAEGKANGADVPLPLQVERALADGYQRRDAREDEAQAARMLPKAEDRKTVAAKLSAGIDEDIAKQKELEGLIHAKLAGARESASAPPQELRAAADSLKAWGMGLAFEKSRLDQLRK